MSGDKIPVVCQGTRDLWCVRGQGTCSLSGDKGPVVCQGTRYL